MPRCLAPNAGLGKSWSAIRSTATLRINIVADGDNELRAKFPTNNSDPFGDVGWSHADNGAPRLHAALVTIEADFEYEYGCGQEAIVIAHVTAVHAPLTDCNAPRGSLGPRRDNPLGFNTIGGIA